MVGMPASAARCSICAPDSLSRLTIIKTVTPSVIIWSAIVAMLAASPSALRIS